ncbi:MAG: hypothetical protein HY706_15390 [Candidatus Hydrogenedentes bacterium]|nr:hypothetical protein [Candidatus Hydrogenedentota bacterium]
MKKSLVVMLGFTMLVLFVGYVIAAPGIYAAGSESKGSEMKAMRCTWTGTVSVKAEKVDGKDVKTPYVKVSEAKAEDGMAMDMTKGMELKIVGAKATDATKLAGKEVEVMGVMAIDADSVAVKAAPKGQKSEGSSSK